MTLLGSIAIVLAAIALLVFITIEWFRQDFAIVMSWTVKQHETNPCSKRPREQQSNMMNGNASPMTNTE
jgi:hypothetical protein